MKIKLIATVLFPYTIWILCHIIPEKKEIISPEHIALRCFNNEDPMKNNYDCLLDSTYYSVIK